MISRRFGAALVGVIIGSLAPATATRATVYQVVFTGHMTTLTDYDSIFGTIPGGLIGSAVRVVERFDDAASGAVIRHDVGGYGSVYGVTGAGVASATLSLNGIAYEFAGNGNGGLYRVNGLRPGYPSYDGVFTYLNGNRISGVSTYLSVFADSAADDFLEQSPFGDFYGSSLDYATRPNALGDSTGNFHIDYGYGDRENGSFKVDRIVVSAADAVPEPAAWTLMIAGFGLTGTALRRRGANVTKGAFICA